MVSYLWQKDGKYYGLDGSVYDSLPTNEEIIGLQTYAKQFVNNREGYERVFNENVSEVLGRGVTDVDYNADTSCKMSICKVDATVKTKYGTEKTVETCVTETDNGCYDISFVFPDLAGRSDLQSRVKYCANYLDETSPLLDTPPSDINWTGYTGVLFSDSPAVDENNRLKYAWFPYTRPSGGFIPMSSYVTYAYIRQFSEPQALPNESGVAQGRYSYDDPSKGLSPWSLTIQGVVVSEGQQAPSIWMTIGRFQNDNQGHTAVTWDTPVRMTDTNDFQTEWAGVDDSAADNFYNRYSRGQALLPSLNDYTDNSGYTNIKRWEEDCLSAVPSYGTWADRMDIPKYMAYCGCNNGQWGPWTITKVMGEDGRPGAAARPNVMAFASKPEGEIPPTPTGGTYNRGEVTNILPEGVWDTDEQQQEGMIRWLSNGTWDNTEDPVNPVLVWTAPVRITGKDGENGVDGEGREFIYRRFEDMNAYNEYLSSQDYQNNFLPYTTWDPSVTSAETASTSTYQQDGFIPNSPYWYNSPRGITEEYRIEVASVRTKKVISTFSDKPIWDIFSTPIIWSSWGEDGIDGDGVEYIFTTTSDADTANTEDGVIYKFPSSLIGLNPPLNFATATTEVGFTTSLFRNFSADETKIKIIYEYYQLPEFIPGDSLDRDKLTSITEKYIESPSDVQATVDAIIDSFRWGWTDNPADVSPEKKYEWVSIRHFKRGATPDFMGDTTYPKVWEEFSEPKLWSRWADDGASVFTAFAFIRTNDDISNLIVTGGAYDNPMPDPITVGSKTYEFSDSVPNGTGDTVWVTTTVFTSKETLDELHEWTSPTRLTDGVDFDVEWTRDELTPQQIEGIKSDACNRGINETDRQWEIRMQGYGYGNWSDVGDDAIYMATATLKEGAWSNWTVTKVKGENGEGVMDTYTYYKKASIADTEAIDEVYEHYQAVANAETAQDALNEADWFDTTPPEDLTTDEMAWTFTLIIYTEGGFSVLAISPYKNSKAIEDAALLASCFGSANVETKKGAYLREFLGVMEGSGTSAGAETDFENGDVKAFLNATTNWYDSGVTKGRLMFAAGITNLGAGSGTGDPIDMNQFSATTKIWEKGLLECKNAKIEGTIEANDGYIGCLVIDSSGTITHSANTTSQKMFELLPDGSLTIEKGSIEDGAYQKISTDEIEYFSIKNQSSQVGRTDVTSDTRINGAAISFEGTSIYSRGGFQGSHSTGSTSLASYGLAFVNKSRKWLHVSTNVTYSTSTTEYSPGLINMVTTRFSDEEYTTPESSSTTIIDIDSYENTSWGYDENDNETSAVTKLNIDGYSHDYWRREGSDGYVTTENKIGENGMLFTYTPERQDWGSRHYGVANASLLLNESGWTLNNEFYSQYAGASFDSLHGLVTATCDYDGIKFTQTGTTTNQVILVLGAAAKSGISCYDRKDEDYTNANSSQYRSTGFTISKGSSYITASTNNVDIKVYNSRWGTIPPTVIDSTGITAYNIHYTASTQSSDERFKNIGKPLDNVLNKIKKIPTTYYVWKDDSDKKQQIGTTAQALLEVFPELVGGNEEEGYGVDYGRLSVVALAAIKELKAEVDALKKEIKKLKE